MKLLRRSPLTVAVAAVAVLGFLGVSGAAIATGPGGFWDNTSNPVSCNHGTHLTNTNVSYSAEDVNCASHATTTTSTAPTTTTTVPVTTTTTTRPTTTTTTSGGGACTTSASNGSCFFPQDTTNFPGFQLGSGRPASQGVEIDQNVWNAGSCPGWTQTLTATSDQDFSFAANYPSEPSNDEAICTYPNEWPHDAQGSVDSYSSITANFTDSMPQNAQAVNDHAMQDDWFGDTANPSAWSVEVMIQYTFSNDAPCGGGWPIVAEAQFSGQWWQLCAPSGNRTFAWKLVAGATNATQAANPVVGNGETSGTVNILAMLKYLETNGYTPGLTWTAQSTGFEIASTSGTTQTFGYSHNSVSMVPAAGNAANRASTTVTRRHMRHPAGDRWAVR